MQTNSEFMGLPLFPQIFLAVFLVCFFLLFISSYQSPIFLSLDVVSSLKHRSYAKVQRQNVSCTSGYCCLIPICVFQIMSPANCITKINGHIWSFHYKLNGVLKEIKPMWVCMSLSKTHPWSSTGFLETIVILMWKNPKCEGLQQFVGIDSATKVHSQKFPTLNPIPFSDNGKTPIGSKGLDLPTFLLALLSKHILLSQK